MRRFVAVVVTIVFATLIAIDGVCCADGCTHEQQAFSRPHGQPSGDGSCMLCLGGINSVSAPALLPSGIVTNRVGLPPLTSHLDAPASPPEHPPRS